MRGEATLVGQDPDAIRRVTESYGMLRGRAITAVRVVVPDAPFGRPAVHALRRFELEGQHVLFAMIFIALSFSPHSIFDAQDRESFSFEAGAVAIDGVWIIVAPWDHRTLARAFERVRPADTGVPSSSR